VLMGKSEDPPRRRGRAKKESEVRAAGVVSLWKRRLTKPPYIAAVSPVK
jgi:hypothetical protein